MAYDPKAIPKAPTSGRMPQKAGATPAAYDAKTLLKTPCVGRTPQTSCATPAVPTQFKASQIIQRDTEEYDRLKHRALAINAEKLETRPADAAKWRKSSLTDQEKYYLWTSQMGRCANTNCHIMLDQKLMTIEHIIPKSKMPEGTWDIRNMTILCHSCNSYKGDRVIPKDMSYAVSAAPRKLMQAAEGKK